MFADCPYSVTKKLLFFFKFFTKVTSADMHAVLGGTVNAAVDVH